MVQFHESGEERAGRNLNEIKLSPIKQIENLHPGPILPCGEKERERERDAKLELQQTTAQVDCRLGLLMI